MHCKGHSLIFIQDIRSKLLEIIEIFTAGNIIIKGQLCNDLTCGCIMPVCQEDHNYHRDKHHGTENHTAHYDGVFHIRKNAIRIHQNNCHIRTVLHGRKRIKIAFPLFLSGLFSLDHSLTDSLIGNHVTELPNFFIIYLPPLLHAVVDRRIRFFLVLQIDKIAIQYDAFFIYNNHITDFL